MPEMTPSALGEGGPGPSKPASPLGETETTAPAVPAATTPPAESKDWKAEYDRMQAELAQREKQHRDQISGLQSSLESQLSDVRKSSEDRNKVLERELNQLRMSTMDEPERAAFEKTLLSRQVSDLESQITELQGTLGAARSMSEAIAGAVEMGIPLAKLDLQHGTQALGTSIWRAVHEELTDLRTRSATATVTAASSSEEKPKEDTVVAPAPLKAGDVIPPTVAAPVGTRVAARTWKEVLDYVGSKMDREVTQEDVWQLVQQGSLPLSIIPGFENVPDKSPA